MQETDVLGYVVFEEKGNEEFCFIYFARNSNVTL